MVEITPSSGCVFFDLNIPCEKPECAICNPTRYSKEEIEAPRDQLRKENRLAKEVIKKVGIKLHPKVAAKKT